MINDWESFAEERRKSDVIPLDSFSENVLKSFHLDVSGLKTLSFIPWGQVGRAVIFGNYIVCLYGACTEDPHEKIRKYISNTIDFSSIIKSISIGV